MVDPGNHAPLRRYTPAFLLLSVAVIIGLRISAGQQPVRKSVPSPNAGASRQPLRFKASYRPLAAEAAAFPQVRKPILVTSADEHPITVGEALDEIKITNSYHSESGRGRSVSTIIRRLCRSALPDEAWKCIEQTAGDARLLEIEAFFLSVPRPDDVVIEKIRSLPEPEDRGAAFAAYLKRVPLAALKAVVLASSGMEDDYREGLDKVLVSRLASDRTGAVPVIRGLHDLNLGGHLAWAHTIVDDPAIEPFGKWKAIHDALVSSDPANARQAWNELLPQMTSVDPARTAQIATSASGKNGSNSMLRQVISQWMTENPATARQWIAEWTPTASRHQLDDIDWALAVHAHQSGDLSEAFNRLESVRDPDTKSRLSRLLNLSLAGSDRK